MRDCRANARPLNMSPLSESQTEHSRTLEWKTLWTDGSLDQSRSLETDINGSVFYSDVPTKCQPFSTTSTTYDNDTACTSESAWIPSVNYHYEPQSRYTKGVNPYGTGTRPLQYLDRGTLSRLSPNIWWVPIVINRDFSWHSDIV